MTIKQLARNLAPVSEPRPSAAEPKSGPPFVGICLEDASNSDDGSVLVSWEWHGETFESRASSVQGASFRQGDQVLMVRPDNHETLIILGALTPRSPNARVESLGVREVVLEHGERLSILAPDGQEIATVDTNSTPYQIFLRTELTTWECSAPLNIVAPSIDLRATSGNVVVSSPEDVIIKGKTIRLN